MAVKYIKNLPQISGPLFKKPTALQVSNVLKTQKLLHKTVVKEAVKKAVQPEPEPVKEVKVVEPVKEVKPEVVKVEEPVKEELKVEEVKAEEPVEEERPRRRRRYSRESEE